MMAGNSVDIELLKSTDKTVVARSLSFSTTPPETPPSSISEENDAIRVKPTVTSLTNPFNSEMENVEAIAPTSPNGKSNTSTSRQLFKEAAEAHGGRESMNLVQHEQSIMQKLRSASSTLDKAVTRIPSKHEKKIGHRRVDEGGEVTYKRIQSKQIMGSIQLGIQHTVGSLASKPKRDLLMNDFFEMETISFPPDGSSITPAHHYNEFRFKVYAPIAFRYFRDLFGIAPDDFLMSMCASPLRQLSNPGASGSIFYLTADDEFIIKTVQKKECEFLQKLLPGYYMNLSQNPRTLLPKFFGLYCFHYNAKNVRLVAMNNLLPSDIKMHAKYDLKGSTFRRKASKAERQKVSPTYKDLDFMEHHPNGIFLETDKYNALMKTIQRDCMVLESFQIMDYSLLVGIHNLDMATKEKREERIRNARAKLDRQEELKSSEIDYANDAEHRGQISVYPTPSGVGFTGPSTSGASSLNRTRSMNRQRLVAHSTAMESITADMDTPIEEDEDVPAGGIPARSENDERLILYIGIIDILQSYRLEKKLEHTFKAIIYNGDTVSVCRPSFYAQRFQNFMGKTVFKKTPTFPLKHSPSKRKSSQTGLPGRTPLRNPPSHSILHINPSVRVPIISGSLTPPPAFDEISEEEVNATTSLSHHGNRFLMPNTRHYMSQSSRLSLQRSNTTDDYSDDDDLPSVSGTSDVRTPPQYKRTPLLHLSKTNVQVTQIGCLDDHLSQPTDYKQSNESIEQNAGERSRNVIIRTISSEAVGATTLITIPKTTKAAIASVTFNTVGTDNDDGAEHPSREYKKEQEQQQQQQQQQQQYQHQVQQISYQQNKKTQQFTMLADDAAIR